MYNLHGKDVIMLYVIVILLLIIITYNTHEAFTLKTKCDERDRNCYISCITRDNKFNKACFTECQKISPIC